MKCNVCNQEQLNLFADTDMCTECYFEEKHRKIYQDNLARDIFHGIKKALKIKAKEAKG